jgi:glycosyltransferase involved in cell wall biosynthesis
LGSAPWLHLHGAFAREAVETVYASIDVLVLPAICQEAFGLVVAEALSAGRPVITTHCGGPAEQVRDGVDGWVVPPNDVAALQEVIQRLAATPELVSAAAEQAGTTVKSHKRYLEDIECFLNINSVN